MRATLLDAAMITLSSKLTFQHHIKHDIQDNQMLAAQDKDRKFIAK